MSTNDLSNSKDNKVCYKCLSEFKFENSTKESCSNKKEKSNQVDFNPQNYAYMDSNLDNVKKLVEGNSKVCVSISSTYAGWYVGKSFKQISFALKQLGFSIVEESAVGASQVISEYSDLMELGQTNVIINTFCPSTVMLIEEHFPELIENLAPISSPEIAHSKLMRETYGDVKVVYIGACHSNVDKSREELAGIYINEVMTFADLDKWLEEKDIDIDEEDDDAVGVDMPLSRLYPLSGGLTKVLDKVGLHKYTPIHVDGLDRCINLFTQIKNLDSKQKIFIEASVCENGCLDTNMFTAHNKNIIDILIALNGEKQPQDDNLPESGKIVYPHPMLYVEKDAPKQTPAPKNKKNQLKLDEFICISCGVRSCKEYAISINDSNEAPFNKQFLGGSANVVLQNSPNGIITFNESYVVTSINPMAEFIYEVDADDVINTTNTNFVDVSILEKAKESTKAIVDKCYAKDEEMYLERTVIYDPDAKLYILFALDISSFNKSRKEYENLRFYADNIAKEITRFLEIQPSKVDPIEIVNKSKAKKSEKVEKNTVKEEKKVKKSSKVIEVASTNLEKPNKPSTSSKTSTNEASLPHQKLETIQLNSDVDKSLVTIMVGPPFDKYYDTTMVSKLMTSNGIRVVCGKTTSQIVSKITGRSIVGIAGSEGIKDAPTTSIEGIHLITHGVMTISRVLENLRSYQKDPNHIEKMELQQYEEATILSSFFINECNHINFLIGDSQDPTRDVGSDPLASFGLKTNLINDLADLLEEMGKRVDLNFF